MESEAKDFAVRLVNQNDCVRIWEIKNHPIVRANSNNQEEVSFASHKLWFDKKYFSGADNHCYVLESKVGKVIGYCRFDYKAEDDAYITSIALDPEYHGHGLGSVLLKESLSQFGHGHGKKILAEIKKDNIPSMKLFKKNNFEIYGEDDINYYLLVFNTPSACGGGSSLRGFIASNTIVKLRQNQEVVDFQIR
ncbi:MAG: hypothetical protein A3H70_01975 [Candidatus Komeilibacteria bacterium RIFCSPLOWO2_02_FULL_48_11]|uniref:N-acetyltransferase domain-containing protein n=1 Tax=Candidatus Komeilibacteria bacterium RIFCSPLOWO2_02_FULL_48_11 TaxID=1798553 RepID=A0A1G2BSS3_9BACT|nr:MAG: hypothetical protein A3H70_01975 [Candidatus Komeilibacteria bacterium RIFCSPLOWO2_02_FULL_48_11]